MPDDLIRPVKDLGGMHIIFLSVEILRDFVITGVPTDRERSQTKRVHRCLCWRSVSGDLLGKRTPHSCIM